MSCIFRRSRSFSVVAIVAICLVVFALGFGMPVVEASDPPGDPASFYGSAHEENGTAIPGGTSIVAVVDGEVEGEITLDSAGEYGGSGAFDDKLRVDSTAGDEVVFRLGGQNGTIGANRTLESGVHEQPLTFPNGSIDTLAPEAAVDINPANATTADSIDFSGTNSTAHEDGALVAFEWTLTDGNETEYTYTGADISRSIDDPGEYTVVLTVSDTGGRTANATGSVDVEPTDTDDGSSGSSATGGAIAGGGGGTGGSSSSGSSEPSSDIDWTREPTRTETRPIADQSPDAAGVSIAFEETAIREIVFEDESASGPISIAEFEEPVGEIPLPDPTDRAVASATEITVPEAHRDDEALIRAFVSETWLSERGIDPADLTIYRLPDGGGQWESLPTEAFETSDGYTVEARTPGFSQFVVAGDQPPEIETDTSDADDDSPLFSNQSSDTTDNTSSDSPASERSTLSLGDRFEESNPIVLVASVCAILLFVAAVGRFLIPRRRSDW